MTLVAEVFADRVTEVTLEMHRILKESGLRFEMQINSGATPGNIRIDIPLFVPADSTKESLRTTMKAIYFDVDRWLKSKDNQFRMWVYENVVINLKWNVEEPK